jgi:hypothetical protein
MAMPLRYEPYEETVDRANVVVDGSPNAGTVLCLTHWPGYPAPPGTEADLSAQMAFRYLDLGADRHGEAEVVTNNHFDQDGLASLYALTQPEHAMANRVFLEDLAQAGDFGRFTDRDAARASMVVAAQEGSDAENYRRMLEAMPDLIGDVERWKDLWADEDEALSASIEAIASGAVTVTEHPDLDLAVFDFADPARHWSGHRFTHQRFEHLHPMAVNNRTDRLGVLVVRGRHYTFTNRYETWVQFRSHRPKARVDLRPLAEELSAAEPGGVTWTADAPGDLAPALQPAGGAESDLDRADVLARLSRHLREAAVAWDPYEPVATGSGT